MGMRTLIRFLVTPLRRLNTNRAQFFVLVQTVAVVLIRKTTRRYTLSILEALSCIFILVDQLYHDGLLAQDPSSQSLGPPEVTALRCLQLVFAVVAAFTSVSHPTTTKSLPRWCPG